MTSPLPTLSSPRSTLISLLPHLFHLFDSLPSHLLSHSVLLRHKFLPPLTSTSSDSAAADSFPLQYLQTFPSPSVEASRVALEEAGLENLEIRGDEWRVEASEGSEGGEEGWVAYVRNEVVKRGTEEGVRVVLCAEMQGEGFGMHLAGSAGGAEEKKERKWKYYDLQGLDSMNTKQIWYKSFQSAYEAFTADLAKASQRSFENSVEEFWDGYSDDEEDVKRAEISSNGLRIESRIDGSSIISSQDSATQEAAEEADYWSSYDSAFSNSPITSHHASPFASRRPTAINLLSSNFSSAFQDPKKNEFSVHSQILESLEILNLKPSTWSPPTPIKELPDFYLNNTTSKSNSIDVPISIPKLALTSPQEEATPLEIELETLHVNQTASSNKEVLALPLDQQVALLRRRIEALKKEWIQGETFGSEPEDVGEEREKLWKEVIGDTINLV